jgi:subtilisin family serine protease
MRFRGARIALALCLLACALSAGAAPAPADPGAAPAIDGSSRIVVTFHAGTGAAAVDDTLAQGNLTPVGSLLHGGAQVVSVPIADASATLAALDADPHVASAQLDGVSQVSRTPNDPDFSSQGWSMADPGFPSAWNTTTGSGIVVAVVDTGVDATHEDLSGAVLPGYNFVAGNTDTDDDYGHGTEVAGVIAGRGNNGLGIAGICWSCKILPVKVLDSSGVGYDSDIANGVEWAADHGAQVINLSIGGPSPDPFLQTAIEYAIGKGALVVIAAGNSGASDPTACGYGECGGYPAYYASGLAGAISVGAVDSTDTLYPWSNYGSWVETAAPGCAVSTTMTGGYTGGMVCGTSFSTPEVAGDAALALSLDPSLTPAELEADVEAHVATVQGAHTIAGGRIDAAGLVSALATPTAPSVTSAASITGTAQVGQTLTASGFAFAGTAPIADTYQWLRSSDGGVTWSLVSGSTASTYGVTSTDVGKLLSVVVTGANTLGSATTTSAATAVVVAAPPPAFTGQVAVAGMAQVGSTLTASVTAADWTGGQQPFTYAYQWSVVNADGSRTPIAGATASTYTPNAGDAGKTLAVGVTATDANGRQATGWSAALGPVAAAPAPAPAPAGGGGGGGGGGGSAYPDLAVQLTTDSAPALGQPVAYRAAVTDKPGNGPTEDAQLTLTLPSQVQIAGAQIGHGACTTQGQTVACDLSFVNPGQEVDVEVDGTVVTSGVLTATAHLWVQGEQTGTLADNDTSLVQAVADPAATKVPEALTLTPAAPAVARPPLVRLPLHAGTPTLGMTLTATVPAMLLALGTPRYQWQAAEASRWTNVAGATRSRLALTRKLLGRRLRVVVRVGSATHTSAPTRPVGR